MKKFYVVHKEDGKAVKDGPFTKREAELHAARCEYAAHGIEYRYEEIKKRRDKVQPADADAE